MNSRSALFVVQRGDDPNSVLVCYDLTVTKPPEEEERFEERYGLEPRTREMHFAKAMRIDLSTGATTTTRVETPYDRERYAVYDGAPVLERGDDGSKYCEAGISLPRLASRFFGIVIPMPQLILINLFGDGAPRIEFDHRLTGRERLVRTRDGKTLLARTLIHGRSFPQSRRVNLEAFESPDRSLLVCVYSSSRGATVWLFRNNTASTQEKR